MYNYDRLMDKLKSYALNKSLWVGAQAPYPSHEAIGRSMDFIEWARQENINVHHVSADTEGGIWITVWEGHNNYLAASFYNNGDISSCRDVRGDIKCFEYETVWELYDYIKKVVENE